MIFTLNPSFQWDFPLPKFHRCASKKVLLNMVKNHVFQPPWKGVVNRDQRLSLVFSSSLVKYGKIANRSAGFLLASWISRCPMSPSLSFPILPYPSRFTLGSDSHMEAVPTWIPGMIWVMAGWWLGDGIRNLLLHSDSPKLDYYKSPMTTPCR